MIFPLKAIVIRRPKIYNSLLRARARADNRRADCIINISGLKLNPLDLEFPRI